MTSSYLKQQVCVVVKYTRHGKGSREAIPAVLFVPAVPLVPHEMVYWRCAALLRWQQPLPVDALQPATTKHAPGSSAQPRHPCVQTTLLTIQLITPGWGHLEGKQQQHIKNNPVNHTMQRNIPVSGKQIKPSTLTPPSKLPAVVTYKSPRFICPNSPVYMVTFFNKGDHFTL